MESTTNIATWLELAVAPHRCVARTSVRLHRVADRPHECLAMSVDGRWLCSGDGRLTLFHGVDTVRRFLAMLNMPPAEDGGAAGAGLPCDRRIHCLHLDRHRRLAGTMGEALSACCLQAGAARP